MDPNLEYIVDQLRPLAVPIESLTPDPLNARVHPPENVAVTRGSMQRFGQYLPLVVQRQGMIVRVGNNRLGIAKELGWTHVAAVVTDHPDEVARALALVDNKSADLARWDEGPLKQLLLDIRGVAPALLEVTGFSSDEINALCEVKWVPAPASAGPAAVGGSPPSHVRMVQLFFNEVTQKEFIGMVDEAARRLGTSSVTDTVMEALRAYDRAARKV